MNENFKYIAGAVAVVGLSVGAIIYGSMRKDSAAPVEEPVVAAPVKPATFKSVTFKSAHFVVMPLPMVPVIAAGPRGTGHGENRQRAEGVSNLAKHTGPLLLDRRPLLP